jgi:hypothetical protein
MMYAYIGAHAAHSFISKARGEFPMEEDEMKMLFWFTILPLVAFGLFLVIGDYYQLGV